MHIQGSTPPPPIPATARTRGRDEPLKETDHEQTAEVRTLADEMVTVFSALEVAREPMATLLLFQEAAHRDAATAELARKVAATLSRVSATTAAILRE